MIYVNSTQNKLVCRSASGIIIIIIVFGNTLILVIANWLLSCWIDDWKTIIYS